MTDDALVRMLTIVAEVLDRHRGKLHGTWQGIEIQSDALDVIGCVAELRERAAEIERQAGEANAVLMDPVRDAIGGTAHVRCTPPVTFFKDRPGPAGGEQIAEILSVNNDPPGTGQNAPSPTTQSEPQGGWMYQLAKGVVAEVALALTLTKDDEKSIAAAIDAIKKAARHNSPGPAQAEPVAVGDGQRPVAAQDKPSGLPNVGSEASGESEPSPACPTAEQVEAVASWMNDLAVETGRHPADKSRIEKGRDYLRALQSALDAAREENNVLRAALGAP